MIYQWDENRAKSNRQKHEVDFADAVGVFADNTAITIREDRQDEDQFVTIGMNAMGQVLVVVYTYDKATIRMISARKATKRERKKYED